MNRFDDDTKAAFIDLYEKVDATINAPETDEDGIETFEDESGIGTSSSEEW